MKSHVINLMVKIKKASNQHMIGCLLQSKIEIFYGKTMLTELPVGIVALVMIVPV